MKGLLVFKAGDHLVMECFGGCASFGGENDAEATRARERDIELSHMLSKLHKEESQKLKLLLLGTGESGKSTITKQMKIIHINGFTFEERLEKVATIHKNVLDSMLTILSSMQSLSISLYQEENMDSANFIFNVGSEPRNVLPEEFWDHCKKLWQDQGVQFCFMKTNHCGLHDSAQYFLDKIDEVRQANYIPSDQDILRCRSISTSIQQIEFQVPDAGENVKFCVFDVGGQRGERKKWIQVFDDVVAILYLGETSSYDQTLREDPTKNRLLESLEIFEQVWNNRFLRPVSLLLFLNKIDILLEKISSGRSMKQFLDQHPDMFPDYSAFSPTNFEKTEFLDACPGGPEPQGRRRPRPTSRDDVNPEAVKAAVYIKRLYQLITTGELVINKTCQPRDREWHLRHTCEYFYTCAVDTDNVKKVLEGCRTIIIKKHLERYGIL
ncbi:hypothetical protein Btru_012634 [Bulinus truncatus]|nr:hypothetical protein Btru_012634 [Bulinus truncatus]